GEMVKQSGIDMLFCYGTESRIIAESAGDSLEIFCTEHPEILIQQLRGTLQEGDVVLFKASHGMHLENIIETLYPDQDQNT
ncbi:MAG: UDP-N-acetylmuramoyl-tripeptide--D-alanyl-D-alanine ligase, partial [Oscillospiraceae bacterium]|nr:UDP-N-acetylmuramoyl-tripeptide--D-alanyl-D-alanine ligase [Oscillospiraceae bacterium]